MLCKVKFKNKLCNAFYEKEKFKNKLYKAFYAIWNYKACYDYFYKCLSLSLCVYMNSLLLNMQYAICNMQLIIP